MYNQVELDERDMSAISDAEKKQKAREFAEGNAGLEELLLFLWNNNVNTYACCGGHQSNRIVDESGAVVGENSYSINGVTVELDSSPYILVDIQNISDVQLKTILTMLCENKEISHLSICNDYLDDEESKPRKFIDIQLKNASSSMLDIAAVFYGAISEGFVSDAKPSATDEEFIQSAIALKNTNIDEIDLSSFKKHYKHFPTSAEIIEITRMVNAKPSYDVQLKDNGCKFIVGNEVDYICHNAYFEGDNGECLYVDADGEFVSADKKEYENMGLMEVHDYRRLIFDLFEKDQSAFFELLKSKPQGALEK